MCSLSCDAKSPVIGAIKIFFFFCGGAGDSSIIPSESCRLRPNSQDVVLKSVSAKKITVYCFSNGSGALNV